MDTAEWGWNLKHQYEPNIEIHSGRQTEKKIQMLVCMGWYTRAIPSCVHCLGDEDNVITVGT